MSRRYTAFISYRHADNTQEGRRWAEWLHRGLERYVVPPDLIGTPNLRGEPIRDSLYPIFRDEDELPANVDLATGIRAALEVSDHLIVLCSPRSAVSPWVRKEVREFKELGRSDRILAIIIAGEPNADDPAKAREGILPDEECFCEELRLGAVCDDGTLDWTIRTEPLAADLRPNGTRAEGFVTAEAYREHLKLNSNLTPDQIAAHAEAYRQQLDHALLKVIAGLLGVSVRRLEDRSIAHRVACARKDLERSHAEIARLRATIRRLIFALVVALALVPLAGWFWRSAEVEKLSTQRALVEERGQREKDNAVTKAEILTQADNARVALEESGSQLDRSQIEEGRAWLDRARFAKSTGDPASAIIFAARAIGFEGYGRRSNEDMVFAASYPPLLSKEVRDAQLEKERFGERSSVTHFIEGLHPTHLPMWAATMMGKITSVVFSPDGTRLAAGSRDRTIGVWDLATGKECAILKGHHDVVTKVAFSPNGHTLASASMDGTVKLWHCASLSNYATLEGHTKGVTSLAFSPDGDRIASGSDDASIRLWDTTASKETAHLRGHARPVTTLAFSPDGRLIASGSSDQSIRLWDTGTKMEIASFSEPMELECVVFSPDGKRIASSFGSQFVSGGDNPISIRDVATGRSLASLRGSKEVVTSLAYSPDGSRLAGCSRDNVTRLWNTVTSKEMRRFKGATTPGAFWFTSIAFSPDGSRLASSASHHFSNDVSVRLWDASVGLSRLKGHSSVVTCVALANEGCLAASASAEDTIKLWDTRTEKELYSLNGPSSGLAGLAFSPDGNRFAAISSGRVITIWDASTGHKIESPPLADLTNAQSWFIPDDKMHLKPPGQQRRIVTDSTVIHIIPGRPMIDVTACLRAGLMAFEGSEIVPSKITQTTTMIHYREDTLAQLANPDLTPERYAELRMELWRQVQPVPRRHWAVAAIATGRVARL